MVGALLFAGSGVAKADANISISYPVQGGEYNILETVTVDVSNELGINARVRGGVEPGVYVYSEIHPVIQGVNVIDLDVPFTAPGVKYMKVELLDDIGGKLGDTGEISFTITAPASAGLFEVPENGSAAILAPIGDLINDGWVFVALAVGIPLAFYVIKKLIALAPEKKEKIND